MKTSVTVHGENFFVLVRANYNEKKRSTVDSSFSIQIGSRPISDVRYLDTTSLEMTVPADLPAGEHDVTLIDPRGRVATLAGGFTIGDAAPDQGIPDADQGISDGPADLEAGDASTDSGDASTDGDVSVDGGGFGQVQAIATDPFGDGTAFSFVVQHGGLLFFGPKRGGTGAVRTQPDGSSPQSVLFSFPTDVTGNIARNTSTPSTSVGGTGCQANTSACGPDNEDGRGIFAAGSIAGQSWLLVGGGRTEGDLDYVYLTTDSGPSLTFRYVDLSEQLGPQTKGISSMHVGPGRIYLGLPDTGGKRPYFVVIKNLPSTPGLDAANNDAENLRADQMPGVGVASPTTMVDSITTFTDRIYIANSGGFMRATVAAPVSFESTPSDWTLCTPSATAYAAKASITSDKVIDIEPADKAVPALAAFKGKLYAARNTVDGPQLWTCAPAASAQGCDSDDWTMVAANTSGDTQLTQFNNPNNVAISLLAATSTQLYVGFDNGVDGLVVFRSASAAPSTRSDFTGQTACSAADHPATCVGLGGTGLGVASNARIFHGVALTFAATDYVYLATGDGLSAVRVYRIQD